MAVTLSALYGTGDLNGITKQQHLFRHGGLTRIRVRDDGEGSTLIHFIDKIGIGHVYFSFGRKPAINQRIGLTATTPVELPDKRTAQIMAKWLRLYSSAIGANRFI